MTSNDPRPRYHVILPSPHGSQALVLCTVDGWVLPGWTSSEEHFWQEVAAVNRGVRDLLGATVATLRACRLSWSAGRRDSYYVVESLDPGWNPPEGARWIDAEAARDGRWRDPTDREVLLDWFRDRPSVRRVDWYRPGWFEEARGWIARQIDVAGMTPIGDVEQLRTWERSSVMRVETDQGRLYFKAVARQWKHEPVVTAYLARRFPDLMPSVVAADPSSGRMLVREFPGAPLPDSADLALWTQAYGALGAVQRRLAGALDDLAPLGLRVRPPENIADALPALLDDERRMRAGMEGGLKGDEIARLRAAGPELADACCRLADGPIPLSLDHGDFWPSNIYSDSERVTLFDWSDATITHPFFSLVMAADEIAGCLPDQPEASRRVIDAYLAVWRDYGTMNELRDIFDDAMLVAPLHQALMYRDVYLPAMEFVDELDRMTPHFLRWLAARL